MRTTVINTTKYLIRYYKWDAINNNYMFRPSVGHHQVVHSAVDTLQVFELVDVALTGIYNFKVRHPFHPNISSIYSDYLYTNNVKVCEISTSNYLYLHSVLSIY